MNFSNLTSDIGINLGSLDTAIDYLNGNSSLYEPELTEVKQNLFNKRVTTDPIQVVKPAKPRATKEAIVKRFSLFNSEAEGIQSSSDEDIDLNLDIDDETYQNEDQSSENVEFTADDFNKTKNKDLNNLNKQLSDEIQAKDAQISYLMAQLQAKNNSDSNITKKSDDFEENSDIEIDDFENYDSSDTEVDNINLENNQETEDSSFEIEDSSGYEDDEPDEEDEPVETNNQSFEVDDEPDEEDGISIDFNAPNESNDTDEEDGISIDFSTPDESYKPNEVPKVTNETSKVAAENDTQTNNDEDEFDFSDFETHETDNEPDDEEQDEDSNSNEQNGSDISNDEIDIDSFSLDDTEDENKQTTEVRNVTQETVNKPVENTNQNINDELESLRKQLAEARDEINKIKNDRTADRTKEVKSKSIENSKPNAPTLQAVKKVTNTVNSVSSTQHIVQKPSHENPYDNMTIDKLYGCVKVYMIKAGVTRRAIDLDVLNKKFGSANISKLIKKSYLIKIGKGVTIGR